MARFRDFETDTRRHRKNRPLLGQTDTAGMSFPEPRRLTGFFKDDWLRCEK
jgi:hypothetical protein